MKKIIKIIVTVIIAIVLLIGVVIFVKTNGTKVAEGTYKITDYEVYPDAYIIVKDNTVQFYNIDLNEIYREEQKKTILKAMEMGLDPGVSEEQMEQLSDLNTMFVSQAFELQDEEIKTGTFSYIYYCMSEGNMFGLVLEYNSSNKTLQINSPVQTLVFEK